MSITSNDSDMDWRSRNNPHAQAIVSEAMRLLGQRRSAAKAAASRANGAKGGRPKKERPPQEEG